jgi:hypothetical protein
MALRVSFCTCGIVLASLNAETTMKTVTKIQLAAAMYRAISTARKLVGANDSVEVVRKGLRWLDLSEGIDLAIFAFGRFENQTADGVPRVVEPGTIVLDIGANIGAHTLHLARLVGPNGECGYQLVGPKSRNTVIGQDGKLRLEIPDGSGISVLAFAKEQLASKSF